MQDLTPQGFSFPLNVYVRLLQLEEGRADFLHYGLFDAPEMTAGAAQQRACEVLWRALPAPCRLLDVGLGLGTSLARLQRDGYAVTGISPEAAQLEWVRAQHGAHLRMHCCRFEDFVDDEGQWQAILFQESSQYIDALDLLERASQLLTAEGELVIMDEFRLRRTPQSEGALHELEAFLALARRFGFEPVLREDHSRQAAQTVDWLLAAVERQHASLLAEMAGAGVDAAAMEQLQATNRRYRQRYADGEYGYFLLRLRRTRQPRWWPGRLHDGQQPGMRALFEAVFGHAMSAAHWQWKYGAGRGLAIVVWQAAEPGSTAEQGAEPRLVAHFGGVRRAISFFGRRAQALQCVDVMVAPLGRATLSRRGPLFMATASCLELELGYGRRQLVGFGFPNRRAFRLPEQLGLYAEVGRMLELRLPAHAGRAALRLALRPLTLTDAGTAGRRTRLTAAAAAQVDACWAAMQASLGDYIVGVRDAQYVEHRYVQHPDFNYRLHVLQRRLGGTPLGVLVLRLHEQAGERSCELVDVVAARQHLPLLLRQAQRLAASHRCRQLSLWLSDNLLPLFEAPAHADIVDLDICLPANAWSAGPPPEQQRERWWLMAGDTDFR